MPKGVLDANATTRCVGHKRDGERCKNASIKGGTVCRYHGGSAPQVQRSARERFNDLIDPMINIAHDLAKEAEEGKLSASDRIAFMKFVADRTGFVPGKQVNVDGKAQWEIMLTPGQAGIIREYNPRSIEDIQDAEVVDDEEDPLERHEREEAEKRAAQRDSLRDQYRDELVKFPLEPRQRGSADPPH